MASHDSAPVLWADRRGSTPRDGLLVLGGPMAPHMAETERQPLSTRDKVGSYTEMELFLESSDLQEFLMGANGACRS